MNTGAATVDIGNYVIKDNNDGHAKLIPPVTMLAPNAYYVVDTNSGAGGFGLGDRRLRAALRPGRRHARRTATHGHSHAPATYGRCPNGTGAMTWTNSTTRGAANELSRPRVSPGWAGDAVSIADDVGVFGTNLSGLAYQPSGTSAPGVLWAVRNNPATLFRLLWDGTNWKPDTANGWGAGKELRYRAAAATGRRGRDPRRATPNGSTSPPSATTTA